MAIDDEIFTDKQGRRMCPMIQLDQIRTAADDALRLVRAIEATGIPVPSLPAVLGEVAGHLEKIRAELDYRFRPGDLVKYEDPDHPDGFVDGVVVALMIHQPSYVVTEGDSRELAKNRETKFWGMHPSKVHRRTK